MDRIRLVERLLKVQKLASEGASGERDAAAKTVARLIEKYPWLPGAAAAASAAAQEAVQGGRRKVGGVDIGDVLERVRKAAEPHAADLLAGAAARATERIRAAIDEAIDGFTEPAPEKPEPRVKRSRKTRMSRRTVDFDAVAENVFTDIEAEDNVMTITFDDDDLEALLDAVEVDADAAHAAIGRAFLDALVDVDVLDAEDEDEDD